MAPAAEDRGGLALLGLGSNRGDRVDNLGRALKLLHAPPALQVLRCSAIYESDPVGPVLDQPPFFNLVAEVRTTLQPRELLRRCQQVEAALGRRREHEIPQGPRTMDVDLLLVDQRVESWPELQLPHPELARRAFVLLPLLELCPDLRDPRDGRPLGDLLEPLAASQRVTRVEPPPDVPAAADEPVEVCEPVNLFTVSALRLHRSHLPPTPGKGPTLGQRLMRSARRLLSIGR